MLGCVFTIVDPPAHDVAQTPRPTATREGANRYALAVRANSADSGGGDLSV